MGRKLLALAAGFATALLVLSISPQGQTQEKPAQESGIPGLTAEDKFASACVDCHVKLPDRDVRLGTVMKGWTSKVPATVMERIKGATPKGSTLKGKHPDVSFALKDIPKSCTMCHPKDSKAAPPFGQMVHLLHLSGGNENHFISDFQGQCVHCHKLNKTTGLWSVPSGPEK